MPVVSAYCPNCGRRVYVGERDERVCPVCTGALDVTELEESRADRIGRNEAMFREVNEQIERVARDDDDSDQEPEEFVCECASLECTKRLVMKLVEYEKIRSHPNRFAVSVNHALPEAEVVVEKLRRYWVVEKTGRAAASAEEAEV